MTMTGSGAPTSGDCYAWAISARRPLARVTTFSDTAHRYSAGISDATFEVRVNFDDDAATGPPIPEGSEISFTGRGGTGQDYAFSGLIETAETGFDRDSGGQRRAAMIYRGRVNGEITVS